MKLYAMFLMDLQRGDPAVEEMAAHLKQHSILALNIKKILMTVGREHVPEAMMRNFKTSSVKLGILLSKCFNDTALFALEDCKWDTLDVLTKEEEAEILAPAG